MINTLYKVSTAVATGAMLLASVGPVALADTSVTISGNGAFSNNSADLTKSNTTTVTQSNTANIQNNVTSNASTGKNSAFGNTGGDTTISTGNASTTTDVSNNVNKNVANVSACGGCEGDTTLKIHGNGVASENDITVDASHDTTVDQTNDAHIRNNVENNAKTGGNDADLNTGGNVSIETGSADSSASVSNRANTNVASVGNSNGNGGSLDITISGNGAFSNNSVDGTFASTTTVTQDNDADILNDVEVNAKTGHNSAFGNTGGDVSIETGNADASASVDNNVNFNWANVEACCFGDVNVDVSGNGAGSFDWQPEGGAAGLGGDEIGFSGPSSNDVTLDLSNDLVVGQTNEFDCSREYRHSYGKACNDVEANAKTGGNDANLNTGETEDPSIMTGNASTDTSVSNEGNVNVYGSDEVPSPLPTPGSSMNFWWMILHGWMNM